MLRTFRVALATALFVVAAPLTAMADTLEFEADLSPEEEVADPPVDSDGKVKPNSPYGATGFVTTSNGRI
jgi:hypothetical protein